MHKTLSLTSLYMSRFIVTLKHLEPLSLKNYICVVALAPDLQRVSFPGVIEFFYHSSTIELLSLLIPINMPKLCRSPTMLEIFISLVADAVRRFMQDRYAGRYPLIKLTNDFWLVRSDPARPIGHGKLLPEDNGLERRLPAFPHCHSIISRSFRKVLP